MGKNARLRRERRNLRIAALADPQGMAEVQDLSLLGRRPSRRVLTVALGLDLRAYGDGALQQAMTRAVAERYSRAETDDDGDAGEQ